MNRSFDMAKLRSILRAALARQQRTVDDHPDANALLAFVECKLSRSERSQILGHLAGCSACREVLALASQTETAAQVWSWPRVRWPLAVAGAIACIVVVSLEANLTWLFLVPETRQDIARVHPAPATTDLSPAPHDLAPVKPVGPPSRARTRKFAPPPMRVIQPTIPPAVYVPPAPEIQESSSGVSSAFALSPAQAPPAFQPNPIYVRGSGFLPQASFEPSATLRKSTRESANTPRIVWSIDQSQPGTLIRSNDGGRTWQSIDGPGSAIDALSTYGSSVWIAGDDAKLYRSSDNGTHWQNVPVTDGTNIPAGPIQAITVQARRVILKTNSGIWSSQDNGKTWTYRSEGN